MKVDRLGSSDLMVIGLHRVWDDLTFLVRAVHHWEGSGAPDWATVNDLAHRVDALLHDHEGRTATSSPPFREGLDDALVETRTLVPGGATSMSAADSPRRLAAVLVQRPHQPVDNLGVEAATVLLRLLTQLRFSRAEPEAFGRSCVRQK